MEEKKHALKNKKKSQRRSLNSQKIDDVCENMQEYIPTKKRKKKLIVFDDMIADMKTNNQLSPIVTELFLRGRKLFIPQFYFKKPKTIRLNATNYSIMKISNKREIQQLLLLLLLLLSSLLLLLLLLNFYPGFTILQYITYYYQCMSCSFYAVNRLVKKENKMLKIVYLQMYA